MMILSEDSGSSSPIIDRHQKYLNLLTKIATTVFPVGNARLASALVFKNEVVSFGINCRKSNPFQKRFGKNEDAIYLHAETSAIRNAMKVLSLEEISRSRLYVCRVKYSGGKFVYGMSRPCSGCQKAIAQFGIRRVIYTIEPKGYDVL